MKKLFVLMLSVLFAFSIVLVGCGQKQNQNQNASSQPQGEKKQEAAKTEAKAETKTEDKAKTDFPKKPIELIVPWAPGGSSDLTGRAIAEALKTILPQAVVVVNRDGANGVIATTEQAKSKGDGYTVLFDSNGVFATQPHLNNVGYSVDDFTGIIGLTFEPILLVVNADSPYKTLDDLVKVKDSGKSIKYGHSGAGGLPHLAQAAFYKKAGIKADSVPFKGGGPAVTALLGGHVDSIAAHPAEVLPQIKAGKLRAVGVFSPEKIAALPDVPTFKEKGFDLDMSVWKFILVQKDTPKEIVDLLRDAFKKASDSAEFKKALDSSGLIAQPFTGDEVIAKLKTESNLYNDIIQALGIGKK